MNFTNETRNVLFEAEVIAAAFGRPLSVWHLLAALRRIDPKLKELLVKYRLEFDIHIPDFGSIEWQRRRFAHGHGYRTDLAPPCSSEVTQTLEQAELLRAKKSATSISPPLLLLSILQLDFMPGFAISCGADYSELSESVEDLIRASRAPASAPTPSPSPPPSRPLSRGVIRDLMLEAASREGLGHHRSTRLAERAAEELCKAFGLHQGVA